MKRRIIYIVVLVILFVVPVILQVRNQKAADQAEHRWFVNTTCHVVYDITGKLETLTSENGVEDLDRVLDGLSRDLIRLHYLLEDSVVVLSGDYYYSDLWGFRFISRVIDGTANSNGTWFNGTAFSEDGMLDNKELALLEQFKEGIDIVLRRISEDGMNGDSNISSEDFKSTFNDFFLKWGFDTYYGYEERFESPFVKFIE